MSKVSKQLDLAANLVLPCMATHNFVPVPPVPPVPPPLPATPLSPQAIAFEFPVPMFWVYGNLVGKNKFTTTVSHMNFKIAQDGHDCGIMIPHIQVAPAANNMLTLMHIPFSSRKSMFCASTVVMNGKSPACCTLVGLPPTPMMYCAEPMSMPLASAYTAHLNSVTVGLTIADWIIGAATIAASMIIDKIFSGELPSGWSAMGAGMLQKVLLGGGSAAEILTKNGLAALTGLARLAFTDGPVDVNLTVGNTYFENQIGLSRDANGNYSGGYSGRIGNLESTANTERGLDQNWGTPL